MSSELKVRVGARGVERINRQFSDMAKRVGGVGESASRSASRVDRAVRAIDTRLSGTAAELTGLVGGLSLGIVARDLVKTEARLTKLGIKFGKTDAQVLALRGDLRGFAKELGPEADALLDAFEAMVGGGMEWDQARGSMGAIAESMLQTGAAGGLLADALGVAKGNFNFDLSKPGAALKVLDQMTRAGQLGALEFDKLSASLGRFGGTAAVAKVGFAEALALAETYSEVQKQPEQLATGMDAFFRMFNASQNLKSLTLRGIKVFDAAGNRRAFREVFADVKAGYDKLTTDRQRTAFLTKAFKVQDEQAVKVLNFLLGGDKYAKAMAMVAKVEAGGAVTAENRRRALADTEAQLGRIKAQWQDIAETQGGPVLKSLSGITDLLAQNPGLTQGLMKGGIAAAAGGVGLKLLARSAGMLEALMPVAKRAGGGGGAGALGALGAQRVWVVNMPGGGMGGLSGMGQLNQASGKTAAELTRLQRAGGIAVKALAGLEAFAVGYGIGTVIDQQFGISDRMSGTTKADWARKGTFNDRDELRAAQASLTTLAERLAGRVQAGALTQDRALTNLRAVARSSAGSMGLQGQWADLWADQVVGILREQVVQGEVRVGIHITTEGQVQAVTVADAKSGRIHAEAEYAQGVGSMYE